MSKGIILFILIVSISYTALADRLYSIRDHENRIGFIDSEGTVVLEPQFDRAYTKHTKNFIELREGEVAVVEKGSAVGIIDSRGDYLLPLTERFRSLVLSHDKINDASRPLRYYSGHKAGLVTSRGRVLCDAIYDYLHEVYSDLEVSPTNHIFSANRDGKWGLLDLSCQEITDFSYDDIGRSFTTNGFIAAKRGGMFGYIDDNLRWNPLVEADGVRSIKVVSTDASIENSYLLLGSTENDDLLGLYTLDLQQVIPPLYSTLKLQESGAIFARKPDQTLHVFDSTGTLRVTRKARPFGQGRDSDPVFFIDDNELLGFIEGTDFSVFPGQFDWAHDFRKRGSREILSAVVKVDGKFGAVDANGEYMIPPEYSHLYRFLGVDTVDPHDPEYRLSTIHLDTLPADKDGKCGYIDWENRVLIPFRFDYCSTFHGDIAEVCSHDFGDDGACWLIDTSGERLGDAIGVDDVNSIRLFWGSHFQKLIPYQPISDCPRPLRAYMTRAGEEVYREQCSPEDTPPDIPSTIDSLIDPEEYASSDFYETAKASIRLHEQVPFDADYWYQDGKQLFEFEIDPDRPKCRPVRSTARRVLWPAETEILIRSKWHDSTGTILYFDIIGVEGRFECHKGSNSILSISGLLDAMFVTENIEESQFWQRESQ